jgi:hypothetical protein
MCRNDRPKVIAAAAGPIFLSEGLVRVPLVLPSVSEEISLAERIGALEPEQHIYVVVRGARAASQPGVLFQLYFDVPEGMKPGPGKDDPRYVGTLNFYDAVARDGSGTQASDQSRSFSFDVTAVLRRLQAQRLLSAHPNVAIAPSGNPTVGSNPRVGRIELIQR